MIDAIDEKYTSRVTLSTSSATNIAVTNTRPAIRKKRRRANGTIATIANVMVRGAFNGGGGEFQ
jgi:hypothetical protein